jgi:hypothetical protein
MTTSNNNSSNPDKLTIKQRLWQLFVITVSNQSIISVCIRDRRYSRKEVDGSEKYTTIERFILLIFYATLLLSVYLVFGMGIAALNVDCALGSDAFSNCFRDRSDNSSCVQTNNTFVAKSDWIVPKSKAFSIGSKHYKFRLFQQLKPQWYYPYKLQFNGTEALHYEQFETHANSFVCANATDEPNKLYCLHPSTLCKSYSNPPEEYNPKTLTKFIVLQVVVTVVTQIGIWIFVSPASSLLMLLFIGVCEPEKGSSYRRYYKIGILVITVIALVTMLVWIFFALFLTFHFFSNVDAATRGTTIGTSFVFWLLTLTIGDTLSAFLGAFFNFPKVIFCGIPVDQESGLSVGKSQEIVMKDTNK